MQPLDPVWVPVMLCNFSWGDMNKHLSSLRVGYLKQAKKMILRLVGEPESLCGVTYGNIGDLKAATPQKSPP